MADLSPKASEDFLRQLPWNPRPLRKELQPEEYPVDSLPPIIADCVREVQSYVQAPPPLVAASAPSVVSAVVQARFDIRRDSVLVGPSSLYFLTLAESGERKTATDKLFMIPLHEWEAKQARAFREAKASYEDSLEAWERRGEELAKAVAQDRGEPAIDPLLAHKANRPKEPKLVRVLRGDDTTEALLIHLQQHPEAAVISAEAGTIFGSHSMGNDTVLRNLATMNTLWDGGPIRQDRIGRESVNIEQVRATYGLQVQPAVLQHFMDRTGGLARGIGYFARFLFSHPESTQGGRYYVDPPAEMPALRAFHARITDLLDLPVQFDQFDRIDPTQILLDEHARRIWIGFHNEVEEQVGGDDLFSGIRDVASKAPENAARLACNFHAVAKGGSGMIDEMTMIGACSVMRWYLDEAVRFAQVTNATEEVRNAELLEQWLVRQLRTKRITEVTVNMIRQMGPSALRGGNRKVDDALDLLANHERVRVTQGYGTKTRFVTVAPQVIREWS